MVDGCHVCPLGHFCVAGSSAPEACPAGSIGRQERLTSKEFCSECVYPSSSEAGSSTCGICLREYYEPPRTDDRQHGGADLQCAKCLKSATCPANTSLATVVLNPGRWRLSPQSAVTYPCAVVGGGPDVNGTDMAGGNATASWTGPCKGGAVAASDGEGYCQPGHMGPLCQICTRPKEYFLKESAKCIACPNPGIAASLMLVAVAAVLVLLGGCFLVYKRPPRRLRFCRWFSALQHRMVLKLTSLALMAKFKLVIAFYQNVQALPKVYGVRCIARAWPRHTRFPAPALP